MPFPRRSVGTIKSAYSRRIFGTLATDSLLVSFPRSRVGTPPRRSSGMLWTLERPNAIPTQERGNNPPYHRPENRPMLKTLILLLVVLIPLLALLAPGFFKRALGPAVWLACGVFFLKFRMLFFAFPPHGSAIDMVAPVLAWVILLAGLCAGYILFKAGRRI